MSRIPCLQNMGMYVHAPPSTNTEPDAFTRLAKGYVVPDKSTKKKEVCALNAEVRSHRFSQTILQVHLHLVLLGGNTSWERTRCAGVDPVRIAFDGRCTRFHCRFVTNTRQGGLTASARPLNLSAECYPLD